MTTDVIDALIERVDQRQNEEKQIAQAAFAKLVESARERAREILNSADTALADLLSPYIIEEETKPFNRDSGITLTWKIEADALALCPIFLHVAIPPNYCEGNYAVVYGAKKDTSRYEAARIAEAVAQARRDYDEYRAWRIDEEKSCLLKTLRVWDNEDGRKKALAARDELIAQFPDETAKWKSAFKELGEAVAQRETNRREDELHKQMQARAWDEYRDEYVAFLGEYERALEANREKAQGVQERFNEPLTLWLLKYGVASVDDGETYLEVREIYVGEPEPNEEGWLMADGSRERFFFPVSVAKKEVYPVAHDAGEFVHCHIFDGYGIEVHAPRSATREDVERALIDAGVVPLPKEPLSSTLDSCQMERVREEARRTIGISEPVDYW